MNHDSLPERAWRELYPDKRLRKALKMRYSGRFKDYNATVTDRPGSLTRPGTITFSLSRMFEQSSDEIKLGVMQHLLNRLKGTKVDTIEIQLYNRFIKKLADYVVTEHVDQELKAHFDTLNHRFFDGYMLTPNLVWGGYTLTKLGHYEYATDTISISTALKEAPELLDYVLYHEMLHKKHKFTESKGGNTRSHTKAFRDEEKKYRLADGGEPEKRLATFLGQRKRRKQGISFKIKDWF